MKILRKRNTVVFTAFLVTASIVAAIILVPKFLTVSSPLDKSIIKQFVYDIDPTYPPVAGLSVDLYNSALLPVGTEVTDASGYVTFVMLTDQTYTLKWTWGGVEHEHSQLIDCTQIVWDLGTNLLESKSGGGLHLAEP